MADVYLVLNETSHGRRFWRTTYDPALERLHGSDGVTLAVFGPATLGPDGYATAAAAAEALADLNSVELDEPDTWPEEIGAE